MSYLRHVTEELTTAAHHRQDGSGEFFGFQKYSLLTDTQLQLTHGLQIQGCCNLGYFFLDVFP